MHMHHHFTAQAFFGGLPPATRVSASRVLPCPIGAQKTCAPPPSFPPHPNLHEVVHPIQAQAFHLTGIQRHSRGRPKRVDRDDSSKEADDATILHRAATGIGNDPVPESVCQKIVHLLRQFNVTPRPYVSFVSYFRNDSYTGDFELRVRRATSLLARQLERSAVESELILVEWNPPAGQPLILDSLEALPQGGNVQVRGIIVGEEHHHRFIGSQEWGMNPAAAANVGLRRAKGLFVTPKAADTYLSDDIIATIARRDLHENALYRCDRCDVALSARDLEELDDDALLARLDSLDSTRHSRMPHPRQWYIRDLHTNACGDFLLMSHTMWHTVRGFPLDSTVLSLDCDSLIMHAAAALGVHEICLPPSCRIFKGRHAHLFTNRITQVWSPLQSKVDRLLTHLRWWRLQTIGRSLFDYPKRKVMGVESVLAPSIERNFVTRAEQWAHGAVPELSQPENWGLADQPLEERVLCRAAWTTSDKGVAA